MARWLTETYPSSISILWEELETPEKFMLFLPLLLSRAESGALDELHHFSPSECISFLKHKNETDAAFVIHCLLNTFSNDHEREAIHDDINLSYRLTASIKTPNISNTRIAIKDAAYQAQPFDRKRPDLSSAIKQIKFTSESVSRTNGAKYIELARKTMLTHERDYIHFPAETQQMSDL